MRHLNHAKQNIETSRDFYQLSLLNPFIGEKFSFLSFRFDFPKDFSDRRENLHASAQTSRSFNKEKVFFWLVSSSDHRDSHRDTKQRSLKISFMCSDIERRVRVSRKVMYNV